MQLSLRFNTSAFSRFIRNMEKELDVSTSGPIQDGMLAASDAYMESQRYRFAEASSGDGTWAQLAPSTVAERVADGESEPLPILHRSGRLEESLERGDREHVLEFTANSVQEGTANEISIYHQHGTEHMPARTILVPPTADTLEEMRTHEAVGISLAVREAAHG